MRQTSLINAQRAIVLIVLVAVALAVTAFHDSTNQALAWLQGCPGYIPGSYALNAGCPLDVHPWLLP